MSAIVPTKLCGICLQRVPAEELKGGRCGPCRKNYLRAYRRKKKEEEKQAERESCWKALERLGTKRRISMEEGEKAMSNLIKAYGGEEGIAAEFRKAMASGQNEMCSTKRLRRIRAIQVMLKLRNLLAVSESKEFQNSKAARTIKTK